MLPIVTISQTPTPALADDCSGQRPAILPAASKPTAATSSPSPSPSPSLSQAPKAAPESAPTAAPMAAATAEPQRQVAPLISAKVTHQQSRIDSMWLAHFGVKHDETDVSQQQIQTAADAGSTRAGAWLQAINALIALVMFGGGVLALQDRKVTAAYVSLSIYVVLLSTFVLACEIYALVPGAHMLRMRTNFGFAFDPWGRAWLFCILSAISCTLNKMCAALGSVLLIMVLPNWLFFFKHRNYWDRLDEMHRESELELQQVDAQIEAESKQYKGLQRLGN